MIELSIGTIAEITGAQPINAVDLDAMVTGPVEFDSRKVVPGSIFMALPGAKVDGHDFVAKAVDGGAALVLAGREVDTPALVAAPAKVEDHAHNATAFEHDQQGYGASVIAAVDKLARYNTDQLVAAGMTVVGVTGSAGKTSTKDMMGAVLATAGQTVAPPGSFNNEIGLPYTALRATETTRFLVAEMSARGVGHIRHLTTVVPPSIGVVLNVGSAHLGEFGSREAIAQAKGELVEALPADGVAVLNADDAIVAQMRSRTSARVVTFSAAGDEGADYAADDVELDDQTRPSFVLRCALGERRVALRVFGAHQVSNALAAIAVGVEAGLPLDDVCRAVGEHTATSERRMDVQTRQRDAVTIINDSYNANPESMRAGLAALSFTVSKRPDASSWAVVGQMGELGDEAVDEHQSLGQHIAELGIDHLVVVGTGVNQQALADAAQAAGVDTVEVESTDAAVNVVDQQVGNGDVVLVKASYSDALWEVAEGLLMGETIVDSVVVDKKDV